MYKFIKLQDILDADKKYFLENNLHINCNIQTIAKVTYILNKIVLQTLSDLKTIEISLFSDKVPEDGTYVHVFSSLIFFGNEKGTEWYNFSEMDSYFKPGLIIKFWNELSGKSVAEKLENMLYKVNYVMK